MYIYIYTYVYIYIYIYMRTHIPRSLRPAAACGDRGRGRVAPGRGGGHEWRGPGHL